MLSHWLEGGLRRLTTNAAVLTWFFRSELAARARPTAPATRPACRAPWPASTWSSLVGVVLFAHHPVVFMGLFLFFLGYTEAYQ